MKVDLAVVGASFAGLACARAAALGGLRVAVIEKKATAGEKLHTTGLVVKDAVDSVAWLREVPAALVRRIDGVRLYAPNLRHVDLAAPGYYFWATDAPALMDWMVESVRACGVDVRLERLFTEARRAGGEWRIPFASGEEIAARYLVGADGPRSRVAQVLGLSRNTEFLFGIEHEYAEAALAPDLLHCFIDAKLAPGYIAWAFAGVRAAQVGLARRSSGMRAGAVDLAPFLHKVRGHVTCEGRASSVRAGLIPCGGLLARVACPGALLVGDAAGMVSPVTVGGIHTALWHGERVGDAVAAHLCGAADDPAGWLARAYPRFRAKRVLRTLYDRFQNDWIFDRLLATAAMRRAAQLVFFHRKAGVDRRVA